MGWPIDVFSIRLFLRLLIGLILLSVGVSKLAHPARFRRGILDYKILPPVLEARFRISRILSFCIPTVELLAGFGLVTGFLLAPAIILTFALFVTFSYAMIVNLRRGRRDLSCHCAGALGNHHISWWLVGRNGLFLISLLVLLFTPVDTFTVETLVRSPSLLSTTLWINVVLPVVLIVGLVLLVLMLFNAARFLFRS